MKDDKTGKGLPVRRPGARRARSPKPASMGDISPSHASSFSIHPEKVSLTQMLEALKPHDHLSLIYESQEEWRAAVVPFIAMGLKRGEKCCYFADAHTAEQLHGYLQAEGVDVVSTEASGQLVILGESEAYTKEGSFDPDLMISLLITETEKAIAEGYPVLRLTGEMTWVLHGLPGSEKLLEYEAKLNRDFYSKYPALGICQYDRWKFDPEIIKGVIMTHPLLVRGNHIYHNFYYVPPEEFLNRKRAEMEAQHWLNNVEREQQIMDTLRQSETKYRTLTEQSLQGLLVVQDFRIVFANTVSAEISGYSVEELLSLPPAKVQAMVHPEDQTLVWGRLQDRLAGKTVPSHYEYRSVRKDGTMRWLEMFANRIEYGGKPAIQGAIIDITERKRAENALRESEEKWRSLAENSPDHVMLLDEDMNILFINRTVPDLSKEEVIGTSMYNYVPPEYHKDVADCYRRVLETGRPDSYTTAYRAKDGEIRYFDVGVAAMFLSGRVTGFISNSHDVTERKLAEAERNDIEEKAEVASRLASIGEMASGIAHEINNPLTAVIGYAQLLSKKELPEDIKEGLEVINDGAQRVAGIIKRLLTFARQYKPEQTLVNINNIIETTLSLRSYHLKTNNIKLTTWLAPDLPATIADAGQLQQVFLNLIVNAETEMKQAHGKGKLSVITEQMDNIIRISFKDDGPGILKKNMERIFNPFFTTRKVGEGTGLGLSVCHGIIAEHGGRIYAESRLGRGATFVIELPIATKVAPPKPIEPAVKKPKKVAKARILVVDDEKVIRDIVKLALIGEGHNVEAVDNAADALKKIEGQKYSLILLDIKMPDMSGIELYERIQKIDRSLARKVVFITGDIIGADTQKFLSATKVAHIDKPFDIEQLSREVQHALTAGR